MHQVNAGVAVAWALCARRAADEGLAEAAARVTRERVERQPVRVVDHQGRAE